MVTISALLINELREAGLLVGLEPHLTDKGRMWMQELEHLSVEDRAQEWAADFVQSINAISR